MNLLVSASSDNRGSDNRGSTVLLHSHTEHCVHVLMTLSAGCCVALLLVHDVCLTCLFPFLYCYDRAQDGQLSSSLLREEMSLPPNLY